MKGRYGNYQLCGAAKKQSQSKPILLALKHCWGLKTILKKQSQFPHSQQ